MPFMSHKHHEAVSALVEEYQQADRQTTLAIAAQSTERFQVTSSAIILAVGGFGTWGLGRSMRVCEDQAGMGKWGAVDSG